MTPTEITLMLGLVVTLLSSVGVPLYLRRQAARQAATERKIAAMAAEKAGEALTWEKINQAIARERDALTVALKEAVIEHRTAIVELRKFFAEEADRIKQRTDYDLDRANLRIRQLGEEVSGLIQRQSTAQPPQPGDNPP